MFKFKLILPLQGCKVRINVCQRELYDSIVVTYILNLNHFAPNMVIHFLDF